jgi:hypothetical protein
MDGEMVQYARRVSAFQLKRLEPGTIVKQVDNRYGIVNTFRLVKFGNQKRLQSLENGIVFWAIKDTPFYKYYVEGGGRSEITGN